MTQYSRTEQLLERLAGGRSVSSQLGAGRVALVVAPDHAGDPQSQLITTFMANLAGRLYPVVRQLDVYLPPEALLSASVPRWTGRTLRETMERFFAALNPTATCSVRTGTPDGDYEVTVVIGGTADFTGTLFVGATGWIAQISTESYVAVSGLPNPVGAYTAATFGVAEIWKQLLVPYAELFPGTPIRPLRGSCCFSAYDYRHDSSGPNPDLPLTVALSRLTAIGLGAGGTAAMYTLASLPDIRGEMVLVEPDEVTESNLNRLVAADAADASGLRPKVEIVTASFQQFRQMIVQPRRAAFDDVRDSLDPRDFERVLAAVHSRAARHSIQAETPRIIWDGAATSTGEFFVWRVLFGQTQCLACRLAPEERSPERQKARQLERQFGQSVAVWLRKIRDNEPFTPGEVAALEQRLQDLDSEARPPHVGQRFGDWDAEQCGRLQLPDPDDEIPVPFAPVLAGVLLAGEIFKEEFFAGAPLAGSYWNALLGQFMMRNAPRSPPRRPDCPICGQQAFHDQYSRRWSAADNPLAGNLTGNHGS